MAGSILGNESNDPSETKVDWSKVERVDTSSVKRVAVIGHGNLALKDFSNQLADISRGLEILESSSTKGFSNINCEYYPCHGIKNQNCMFCFCPLYAYDCSKVGSPSFIEKNGKSVKDCSKCSVFHEPSNYDLMMKELTKIME